MVAETSVARSNAKAGIEATRCVRLRLRRPSIRNAPPIPKLRRTSRRAPYLKILNGCSACRPPNRRSERAGASPTNSRACSGYFLFLTLMVFNPRYRYKRPSIRFAEVRYFNSERTRSFKHSTLPTADSRTVSQRHFGPAPGPVDRHELLPFFVQAGEEGLRE
jgi:hypothetical protein